MDTGARVEQDIEMTGLGNACSGFDRTEIAELRAIAKLYRGAGGPIIKLSEYVGSKVEVYLKKVPGGGKKALEAMGGQALKVAYGLAGTSHGDPDAATARGRMLSSFTGEGWHRLAATASGAVGGAGGFATTMGDLALTTTLILRSIQQIAAEYGEDIADDEVRLRCLDVFGFGGPLAEDDEVESGLYGVRLAVRGKTLETVVRAILPRFGMAMSEKAAAQAVPIVGAIAGAAINHAFAGYYQKMAHVQFRLRRLEAAHGIEQVRACFERVDRELRSRSRVQ